MKYTLLELVQKVLNDTDGEEVDSISDSVEAQQIASMAEDAYYELVVETGDHEHERLLKLTPRSDSNYPTVFEYPANTKEVCLVQYDTSDTPGTIKYTTIPYVEPFHFINQMPSEGKVVFDEESGVKLTIHSDKHPSHYTSFNDSTITMNGYNSLIDTTLQESKTRAWGIIFPEFNRHLDSFVPDLRESLFPRYLAELKARHASRYGGGANARFEKELRDQRFVGKRNHKRTCGAKKRPLYGRCV